MYFDPGSLTALALLILIAATLWFWNNSLHARERIITACRALCRDVDLQLLDETVALHRLRLQRGPDGRLELVRRYRFEYSRSGTDRWPGEARLAGSRLESVWLQGPDGVTLLDPASRR